MSDRENIEPAEILVVEDTLESLRVLVDILTGAGYMARPATSGHLALESAKARKPDLVLLDINMPEMDGYQVCDGLKKDEDLADVPVLFISALDSIDDKLKGFELGAVDYVTKPFLAEEILARISTHLKIHRLRRDLADERDMLNLANRNSRQEPVEIFWPSGKARFSDDLFSAFGYAEGIIPKTMAGLLTIIAPSDQEETRRMLNQALEGRNISLDSQCRVLTAKGQLRWIRMSGKVVEFDQNGHPSRLLFMCRDISGWIKSQERLREHDKIQRRMEYYRSMSDMAGGMAHDLNNLMQVIIGYAGVLREKTTGDPEAADYLKCMENAADKAAGLAAKMLDFAGVTDGSMNPVSINDILRDELSHASESFTGRLVPVANLDDDIPEILASGKQIHRMIREFMSNSLDAIPESGGNLSVATRLVWRDDLRHQWNGETMPKGSYIKITIEDTGCGIAPENLDKIFNPFFTTKFIGRGLGLSVVDGVVRLHRGTINVRSEPGRRTAFDVYLPVVTDE